MPIILLSSDLPGHEKPIALAVADGLGYTALGPDVIPEVAGHHDLPADKLAAALQTSPPAWRREATRRWLRQLAHLQADVLERLKGDNVVCWGLAAHCYVLGVSHALKVRLLGDDQREALALAEAKDMPLKKAHRLLADQKRRRNQWAAAAFGSDEEDPGDYDLVINMDQIDPDEVVSAVSAAVGYRKFQPMTYSVKRLAEGALAARVRAQLLATMDDVRVEATDGKVKVVSKAMKRDRQKKAAAIKAAAGAIPGVDFVEVHLINYVIRAAAESCR